MNEELFEQYREMFGEPFPLMLALSMDDDEIRDAIEDCLVTGKPFRGNAPEDAVV